MQRESKMRFIEHPPHLQKPPTNASTTCFFGPATVAGWYPFLPEGDKIAPLGRNRPGTHLVKERPSQKSPTTRDASGRASVHLSKKRCQRALAPPSLAPGGTSDRSRPRPAPFGLRARLLQSTHNSQHRVRGNSELAPLPLPGPPAAPPEHAGRLDRSPCSQPSLFFFPAPHC